MDEVLDAEFLEILHACRSTGYDEDLFLALQLLPYLRREVGARTEVGEDAPAQVLRLADVDDDAPAISHEITAGATWDFLESLAYQLADHLRLLKLLGGLSLRLGLFLLAFRETLLELALRLAERTRELGDLAATEKQRYDRDDDEQLPRADVLKKSEYHD